MNKTVDFFIAGNSKSGTSALYALLQQHPEICMSDPKEPNFFASDLCHGFDEGAFKQLTLSQYHACFRNTADDQRWGDGSASYLFSREAAENIHRYNADAKVVVILREPVDFLHSYHLQMVKNTPSEGETEKDFSKALLLENERKAGRKLSKRCRVPKLLYYSERVKYVDQLRRYERFSPSSLKTLVYDDFKADNLAVTREIFEFLGVESRFVPKVQDMNVGRSVRSKRLQESVHRLSTGAGRLSGVKAAVKLVTPRRFRRRALTTVSDRFVFGPKPRIEGELKLQLKRQFLPEVEYLSDYLDRDLVHLWEYDKLG